MFAILGDLNCDLLVESCLPDWLNSYIFDIGTARVPAFLDLTDFHILISEHIDDRNSNGGCASCSVTPRDNIRTFSGALTAAVGSIAKVSIT